MTVVDTCGLGLIIEFDVSMPCQESLKYYKYIFRPDFEFSLGCATRYFQPRSMRYVIQNISSQSDAYLIDLQRNWKQPDNVNRSFESPVRYTDSVIVVTIFIARSWFNFRNWILSQGTTIIVIQVCSFVLTSSSVTRAAV